MHVFGRAGHRGTVDTRPLALVTGATSGIGRAIAFLLAARGHDLVVVARDGGALGELAVELDKVHGASCEVLMADLSSRSGVRRVARRIEAREDLEVLVNCAGAGWYGSFADQDADDVQAMVDLDVVAVTTLCRAAVGPMRARRRGMIMNVSSTACFAPGPNGAVYHAAKAYVTSFTEALHEELRPFGVHVTALCPGLTPTGFQDRAGARRDGLPAFLWTEPDVVAERGLQALAQNEAVCIPGRLNWALAEGTRLTPRGVIRRASGKVVERVVASPGARR